MCKSSVIAIAWMLCVASSANALAHKGQLGDDKPTIEYVATTGQFIIHAEGTDLNTYQLLSSSGIFNAEDPILINPGGFFKSDSDDEISENFFTPTLVAGTSHNLGAVAPVGLQESFLLDDLTMFAGLSGAPGMEFDLYTVPEPAALVLAGMSVLGLAAVRRRAA